MTQFPFRLGKIFVFGSNLAGIHAAGAAREAKESYGAINSYGIGLLGMSYAIPTKDVNIKTLPLYAINLAVANFLVFAHERPAMLFYVTAIGTGLAGYTHAQIAPMFRHASENCELPEEWKELLKNG